MRTTRLSAVVVVAGLPDPEVVAPDRHVLPAGEERLGIARKRHNVIRGAGVVKLAVAGLRLPLEV